MSGDTYKCSVLIIFEIKSLVAQTVKNLPAMQETQVQSQVRKIPWTRAWQPTPVFFPGEFHGLRNVASYSLWGCKESDTIKGLTQSSVQLLFHLVGAPLTVKQCEKLFRALLCDILKPE